MLKGLFLRLAGLIIVISFFTVGRLVCEEETHGILNPLKIEAKTDCMVYRLGQEVLITVFIKNISDETIALNEPAIDSRSLYFEIVNPLKKSDKLLDIHSLKLKKIRLYPKKRLKFTTKFVPEQLGSYEIKINYHGYEDKVLVARPITLYVVR